MPNLYIHVQLTINSYISMYVYCIYNLSILVQDLLFNKKNRHQISYRSYLITFYLMFLINRYNNWLFKSESMEIDKKYFYGFKYSKSLSKKSWCTWPKIHDNFLWTIAYIWDRMQKIVNYHNSHGSDAKPRVSKSSTS